MRLVADHLACERNGREVFRGVSFTLAPGEYLELTGPNGSGKTSLLRLIAGLVPAGDGTVQLLNSGGESEPARFCHYVGHLDGVKPALTVRENLAFWAGIFEGSVGDAALTAFELLSLADQSAAILSAGQRRRLALTRLCVAKRPIWLLDEPSTALDRTHQRNLVKLIKSHLTTGGLVIAATHAELGVKPSRSLVLGPAG